MLDFLLHDFLRQTEFRNTVHQHAARGVQCLEHRNLIAKLCQVAGAGQAGRAGAQHRYLVAVMFWSRHRRLPVVHVPVGHIPLQAADSHRLVLDAPDAFGFALGFLRAYPSAYGGQRVLGLDDLVGLIHVSFHDLMNEILNRYVHRAALNAGRVLALQAALGLVDSHLIRIS